MDDVVDAAWVMGNERIMWQKHKISHRWYNMSPIKRFITFSQKKKQKFMNYYDTTLGLKYTFLTFFEILTQGYFF